MSFREMKNGIRGIRGKIAANEFGRPALSRDGYSRKSTANAATACAAARRPSKGQGATAGPLSRPVRTFEGLDPIAVRTTAQGEQWALYCYKRDGQWRSLALTVPPTIAARTRINPKRPPKTRFYVGWNGHRFADRTEFRRLRDRHPEMVTWLREVCPQIASINDQKRETA